jgi:hypothetical protein
MAILLHDVSDLYNIRLALSFEPRFLRYGYRFGPWGPEPWRELLSEPLGAPLEVRRISYASPGFIDFSGVGETVEQVRILIDNLIVNFKQTRRRAKLENDQREADVQAQRIENARNFLQLTGEARELGFEEGLIAEYFLHQVDGAQERILRQIERRGITGVKQVSDSKGKKGQG